MGKKKVEAKKMESQDRVPAITVAVVPQYGLECPKCGSAFLLRRNTDSGALDHMECRKPGCDLFGLKLNLPKVTVTGYCKIIKE